MKEISAREAWKNVNETNSQARWKSVVTRASNAAILANNSTKHVGIRRDDKIFCIGSCFAKNIEAKLVEAGFRVVSHPKYANEASQPFAALPNIFNVCSIVNEFRWGLTGAAPKPEDSFVSDDQGYLYDPNSTVDSFRGLPDVVRTQRAGVTGNMRRLGDCRIVIITLGLVEVWYDKKTNLYLNSTLPRFLLQREPDRYVLRVLNYKDCLDGLEEIWGLLNKHGHPEVQIFLSVSPVPLVATFTQHDVLVANNYSKATQVAAARDFAARYDNVHYIPSYESVVNSTRRFAWKGDLRHVTDEMVGYVTDMFLEEQLFDSGNKSASLYQKFTKKVLSDWPIDLAEVEEFPGLPKFFSSAPGDVHFPAGFPKVTASSELMPQLDASCLMSASKRIWHSKKPPAFPEWLNFKFEKPLCVKKLFIQNQDGHPERSPKVVNLEALVGDGWQTLLAVKNAQWRYGGEWQAWDVRSTVDSHCYRIQIFANCGDPNLVTVQNVYLSP